MLGQFRKDGRVPTFMAAALADDTELLSKRPAALADDAKLLPKRIAALSKELAGTFKEPLK